MSTKQNYVVGFLFDVSRSMVALILKQKPAWQKGRWNGIGGKIEAGEEPHAAMVREFREETGILVLQWEHFARIEGEWGALECFTAHSDTKPTLRMQAGEIERPMWVTLALVGCGSLPLIPNLHWLIPLALDRTSGFTVCQDIPVNNL